MTSRRMAEANIDASLDAYLHGAKEGDIDQAWAARAVADSGEFRLEPARICEIFNEVSATVGGFGHFQTSDATNPSGNPAKA